MKHFDIVLEQVRDTPTHQFIELEDDKGNSIQLGEWLTREDGYTVIRIPAPIACNHCDLVDTPEFGWAYGAWGCCEDDSAWHPCNNCKGVGWVYPLPDK